MSKVILNVERCICSREPDIKVYAKISTNKDRSIKTSNVIVEVSCKCGLYKAMSAVYSDANRQLLKRNVCTEWNNMIKSGEYDYKKLINNDNLNDNFIIQCND